MTVNRLCGSGMDAIATAARAIRLGEAGLVAGGVESMSRAPFVVPKPPARSHRPGRDGRHDARLAAREPAHGGARPHRPAGADGGEPRGRARHHARGAGRVRARQPREGGRRADAGRFAAEIVAVDVARPQGDRDGRRRRGPARDSSLEALAKLRPAFVRDGTVTAGNSSTLNDGAGALLLTSPDYALAHGLRPLARIRSVATAGVPPRIMGIGPVPAAAKALERAGLRMEDMDLVEVNEAFAAQVLAVLREWEMDADDERLNVNGGAIALGHPLGASGARIVATLAHELPAATPVRPSEHVHRRGPGHRAGARARVGARARGRAACSAW